MGAAQHLELQAFREGFHAGADPSGKRRRHSVHQDAKLHAAWRRGYTAGQAMAQEAADSFRAELEADARPPFEFSGVCDRCGELVAGGGKSHEACAVKS